jgi:hypothetical protein
MAVRACVCFVTWDGRGMVVASHCDKAGAEVLVPVLVVAVAVCVGSTLIIRSCYHSDAMPPALFFGHGHAPACTAFASAFQSHGKGNEVRPLRPRANAAAGWRCCCCSLR